MTKPTMLNHAQITAMLEREREAANEGVLIGLCAAAVSGAIVGMAILVVIQWWAK